MTDRIDVVVPARDEERRVGRAVDALLDARAELVRRRPDVGVGITIVLDRCVDGTAGIVLRLLADVPDSRVVRIDAGSVGTARRTGSTTALRTPGGPDRWLAFTDADSRVPVGWLAEQLAVAESGAAALVGGVVPDPDDLAPEVLARWRATHVGDQALGHVHGANLGVRADTYLAVGGFADLVEHEDVDLVRRVRAAGSVVHATLEDPVVTSGRFVGRTPGGYAEHLLRSYGPAAGVDAPSPATRGDAPTPAAEDAAPTATPGRSR